MTNNTFDNLDMFNPAPRCPVTVLCDVSGSMSGQRIDELNAALRQFIAETKGDEAASLSVDLEVITFNDTAQVVLPFTQMADVNCPAPFIASGMTSMGAALTLAENDLKARRKLYKEKGFSSYRPWVVLFTDGGPNDAWQGPAARLRSEAERGKFTYIGVEIGSDADHATMCQILPAEPGPVKLKGLCFRQFFRWLSDSLKSVSASAVSAQDSVRYGSINAWADLV